MIQINKKLLCILLVFALLAGAGAVLVLASNGVGGTRLLTADQAQEADYYETKYSKMEELFQYIKQNYYKDIDDEKLLQGAYAGLFEGTGDQYSQYISPEEFEKYYQYITGSFYGVGMTFQVNSDGFAEVVSTMPDSPALKAGIQSGDIIKAVDGKDVYGLASDEIRDLVRGENGTEVNITFERSGEEYTVGMKREPISEITVNSSMISDSNIGYIEITQFGDNTGYEFETELKRMEDEGAGALIIDLRYNGGGIVDSAIEVADCIMDAGTVVYCISGNGERLNYTTEDGRTALPYILLVNGYTASASEMLAAGVQDNNEGRILGTQTYGKGIIQESVPRGDGSAVVLTIREYFSASGKKIHGIGITPDYVVELPYAATEDVQLLEAINILKESEGVYFNQDLEGTAAN